MRQPKPTLLFIAGFLGSGKTTLILQAAKVLLARGKRVALLTNDQSSQLVDTAWAAASGLPVAEITGGCFCCRFSDLVTQLDELSRYDPDVIFAEPVGSCTDISATVLQPMKAEHRDRFQLGPLTVLIDPAAAETHTQAPDSLVSYLFQKQIAEADLVCLNKIDLPHSGSGLPENIDFFLSAETGAGVEAWLDVVLAGSIKAGHRILDIDYEKYAAAEAALGWLNWHAVVTLAEPLSPALLIGPLLHSLCLALEEKEIAIAHCKLLDRTDVSVLKASLCRNAEQPVIRGELLAPPAASHELLLNLRAHGDPAVMREVVASVSAKLPGSVEVHLFDTFRPPAPKPQRRFKHPAP